MGLKAAFDRRMGVGGGSGRSLQKEIVKSPFNILQHRPTIRVSQGQVKISGQKGQAQ